MKLFYYRSPSWMGYVETIREVKQMVIRPTTKGHRQHIRVEELVLTPAEVVEAFNAGRGMFPIGKKIRVWTVSDDGKLIEVRSTDVVTA